MRHHFPHLLGLGSCSLHHVHNVVNYALRQRGSSAEEHVDGLYARILDSYAQLGSGQPPALRHYFTEVVPNDRPAELKMERYRVLKSKVCEKTIDIDLFLLKNILPL